MTDDIPLEDEHWLEWGKANLLATHDVQDDAAKRLTAAVGWVWTLYTGVVLVGFAFVDLRPTRVQTFLVILPVGLLLIAYLLATHVTSPIDIEADLRSPTELRRAHQSVTTAKRRRLHRSEFALAAAAISVALAVGITVTTEQQVTPSLTVDFGDGSPPIASVAVRLPDVPEATLDVTDGDGEGVVSMPLVVSDGLAETTFAVPADLDELNVTVSWMDEEMVRSVSRSLAVGD